MSHCEKLQNIAKNEQHCEKYNIDKTRRTVLRFSNRHYFRQIQVFKKKIFQFDLVTCRGCCGCYGWDNFDPKAVSESLKQLLQMKTRIIALSHLWLEWRPAENRSKFPLNGTAEFSRFDYVTCRSCCGCYGWDIFDPRPVSDSLSQNLCLKKKIFAPAQLWTEWRLAEKVFENLYFPYSAP